MPGIFAVDAAGHTPGHTAFEIVSDNDRLTIAGDLILWERYRETLGDHVPQTFATFQKHRSADDLKYKLWKLDYRRQRELIRHPERALPGAATATAAEAKFTKYFFNPNSKDGYPKGIAFSSHFGYNADNWQLMRQEILEAAKKYPAVYKASIEFGDKYSQDVILYGRKGKPGNVRLGWLVEKDGSVHLTTAHMEEI